MDLDLRTIRGKKFSGHYASYGGTVNVSWSSEVKTDKDTYLLENDSVEEFIWEFIKDDLNVKETNHYACEQLDYMLEFESVEDVPNIKEDFRHRMSHIMTCITWDTCPLCGDVVFTFVNPDYLDTIWDKQEFKCCSRDQREAAQALREAYAKGDIHEDYLNQKLEQLSILIEDGEVEKLVTDMMEFVIEKYNN